MKPLTARQKSILEFIDAFGQEKGYAPSIRDIVKGCDISSTSVVDYNLRILERGGYLRRDAEVSRGIVRPGKVARSKTTVPVLGEIAAGLPIPVPGDDRWDMVAGAETIEVTPDLVQGKDDVFALRVKGTSMIDALINDGDIVLMRPSDGASNGEMVAVFLKDRNEVTLKKFYLEGDRVRLQPANSTMQPIYAEAKDVEVQGRVVGVIRQM